MTKFEFAHAISLQFNFRKDDEEKTKLETEKYEIICRKLQLLFRMYLCVRVFFFVKLKQPPKQYRVFHIIYSKISAEYKRIL